MRAPRQAHLGATRGTGRRPCIVPRMRQIPQREQGFTLIELMIALLVASLLIGLVFSIYTRMSVAYRAQTSVSELQQSLRNAKMHIVRHVRLAGHMVPNGFRLVSDPATLVPSVDIKNNPEPDPDFNSDTISVYYADATAMARPIVDPSPGPYSSITVDDVDDFKAGDLAVIVKPDTITNRIISYDACVVRVTGVVDNAPVDGTLQFSIADPDFNSGTNAHCNTVFADFVAKPPMVYRFVARTFRIDPDPGLRTWGVLQSSSTGELVADPVWEDIGVGFTDLQIAARYFESGGVADPDGDLDPTRDWYSGTNPITEAGAILTEISLSLAVRTTHDLDVVSTSATPNFTEGNPNYNRLGDSPSITLAGVPDGARPEQHRGNHIYRFSSTRIDLRNMGVGQ